MLFPKGNKKVEKAQEKQKQCHDNSKRLRVFVVGDKVLVKNFRQIGPKWICGTISKVNGPLSYTVELTNGCYVKRHVDFVRKRDFNPKDQLECSEIEPGLFSGSFGVSNQPARLVEPPASIAPVDLPETSVPPV